MHAGVSPPDKPLAQWNGFVYIKGELKKRIMAPTKELTFWLVLVLSILAFGGLGVWFEVIQYWRGPGDATSDAVLTALVTFCPALVGTSAVQLICQDDAEKPLILFGILCVVFFIVVAALLVFVPGLERHIAFLCAGVAYLGAIGVWWVANGLDPTLRDGVNRAAALGGGIEKPLEGTIPTDFKS